MQADGPARLKLAVIVDGSAVQRFALDALDAVEGADEITVFSCTNTRLTRRLVRHGAYYALNLLSVRNRLTRSVPVTAGTKRIARQLEFESGYEGAWQVLPPGIVDELRSGGFDVILKFGMGLLRVPAEDELPVPILSYHHGDPDRYRGRPAGFWELVEGAPVMGQVVQVIGNRLDAGKIVAYAQTKTFPWSYRATLLEAFRHSPLIINQAIRNAVSRNYLPKPCSGRNWRLPSNAAVVGLSARMGSKLARRLAYGAAVEKAWNVSSAPLAADALGKLLTGGDFPPPAQWRTIEPARGYSFYADPFYSRDLQAILVEALDSRSSRGAILAVSGTEHRPVIEERDHLSYPSTAEVGGREIIIPESARWSAPRVYSVEGTRICFRSELKVAGEARVTDPTLIEHGGRLFLFGNSRSAGSNVLQLWSSESIETEFTLHPASPVLISPRGSRMGGSFLSVGDRLIRLGQDFSSGYGDGLIAFEVETLSGEEYREREIGTLRFADRKGPHTLNWADGQILFDWYRERFSPLAGVRRLSQRRAQP